jgi:predicted metalloprotease
MRYRRSSTARAAMMFGAAAASVITVLTGCTAQVGGHAVSPLYDPFHVGGLPAVDGPSRLRDNAPKPAGKVVNSDGGDIDKMALSAINDVEQFWSSHYEKPLQGSFRRVARLISYDSEDRDSPRVCGRSPYRVPNAFFCPRDRSIAWDRGVLLPVGEKFFGPMSIVGLVAHEYGHALQYVAETIDETSPPVVREQQADCYAGVYMRWVAEGQSWRFELSTVDGLSQVLSALIAIRDPVLGPGDTQMLETGHGTALDRVSAFQTGFVTGTDACAAIDLREVEQRRGDLPMSLQAGPAGAVETGEAPINENTLSTLMETLNRIFAPTNAPTLSFSNGGCVNAEPTSPASYCPATNTISVDLPELRKMGTAGDETEFMLVQGDNTALSIVVSRYMLAVQQKGGLPLDSATTALRTACLTGVAQRKLIEPAELPSGDSLVLTAGDIDEAVAGLLTNGRAATDVGGVTVPAGFTRIVAFQSGLLDDQDGEICYRRFT